MAELKSLAVLELDVEYRSRRGGNADITSKQKRTVVRAKWQAIPLRNMVRGVAADRLFNWLLQNNNTYAMWVDRHARLIEERQNKDVPWREMKTAELLLASPGIEIAVRPWLYPLSSFADTDLLERLVRLDWMSPKPLNP